MIQNLPPDNAGGHELTSREATVDAASYDDGVAALRALVGDGERIITLRVSG